MVGPVPPCTLSSCSDVDTRCIDVIRSMAPSLKEPIVFFFLLLLLMREEGSCNSSVLFQVFFPGNPYAIHSGHASCNEGRALRASA